MALDYAESSALMANTAFVGRVKVACLKYARYIMDEAVSTPGHSSRLRWAQQTTTMPDGAAAQITPSVVMDDAVQSAGEAVTDTALQGAVENAVNKLI